MPITKPATSQLKNDSFPRTYRIIYKSAGARSTKADNAFSTLPGATGDTSFTAPADQDIQLFIWNFQMMLPGTSVLNWGLSVNGTVQMPYSYIEPNQGWQTDTLVYTVDVPAGTTVTLDTQWRSNGGTAQATNNTTDQQYPNEIRYLAIPKWS